MERDKSKNRIRNYILFLSLTLNAGMLFSQQNFLPQQLETMDIVIIEPQEEEEVLTLLPDKNFIYQTAMNVMPQIKNSKLETEYSKLGIAKAKAGYLPKISRQAGAATGNIYNHSTYDYRETGNVKYYLFNKLRLFIHPLFSYFCDR